MGVLGEKDLLRNFVALVDENGLDIIVRICRERSKEVVARVINECEDVDSLLKSQGELICIERFIRYFENREKRLKMLDDMAKEAYQGKRSI